MASLFGVNPFSTAVGQRIERATDSSLPSEDWTLNIEICDIINETEEGPKDAVKALKKILATNKNYKSVLLTLTVLETCVKNCGHRFHVLVAKKDFIDELTKILSPKNSPPQVVQEKILALIQGWADAFRDSPDLSGVVQVYRSLKEQGIEFPAQDLDTLSPIFTPERTQPERPATVSRPPPPPAQPPAAGHFTQPAPTGGPVHPTPEQLAKLRSELDIVQGNITVMSDMLTEMTPGQEEAGDVDLLQELNRTCRAMQQRLLKLLEQVANEEVIGELLRINDDLNNVFIRYDRYERFRQAAAQQNTPTETQPAQPAEISTPSLPAPGPVPQPSPVETLSSLPAPAPPSSGIRSSGTGALISFEEEERSLPGQTLPTESSTANLTQQLQDLGVSSTDGHLVESADHDDDFDMFAQSRKSTFEESRKMGSSYTDNATPFDRSLPSAMAMKSDKPELSAMDSVESWLAVEDVVGEGTTASEKSSSEVMSSSEFDKFLEERAQASGQRSSSVKAGSSRPRQRQMQMENPQEDDMFGL